MVDLSEGRPISAPRSYFDCVDENPTAITLCGFCDAFTRAYAAVIYLVLRTSCNVVRFGVEPYVETEPPSMPEECIVELKTGVARSLTLVNTVSKCVVSELIDCKRFSALSRVLRVTAQVLRAVEKFKNWKNHQGNTHSTVTLAQMTEAGLLWVKDAQQSMSQKSDFESHKRQFNLFKDEKGVWRCEGRLSNAGVPYAVKNPILLPRSHPLTTLIVREAHACVFHNGIKETLTEIRRKYWIPRVRSLTRQIIHCCVLCRRLEGMSFKPPPPPPPLPTFRVKEDPAFTYTGVDFAGPLYVHGYENFTQKVWICLFTCYVTRAVHLDVVPNQSTETFIRWLKRFSARRGLLTKFISDNGKTFKAAAKYLKTVFKDGEVKEYLTGLGTDWIFNVERAPWWGGAFERMVKSTKRCLRKLIGRAQFSLDELVTVLAEIESVINSRPLTYVSAGDMEEPLTPSHLIVGRRILNLPDHLSHLDDLEDEEFSPDSTLLTRRMKHLGNTLNHFWNRWRSEYLNELREAHSYTARRQTNARHSVVSVGDVVIVHDEHLPRGLWKLGKIKTVMKGRDGQIRGATVKMANKDGREVLLSRPIQLLYPLEVRSQEPTSKEDEIVDNPGDVPDDVEVSTLSDKAVELTTSKTPSHTLRAVAQRADVRRKACMFELEDN